MRETIIRTVRGAKRYYNPEIWPVEMEEPSSRFPGIDQTLILPNEIPFEYTSLHIFDVIKNDYGDELIFMGDGNGYLLWTNSQSSYLENWFCKWEIK